MFKPFLKYPLLGSAMLFGCSTEYDTRTMSSPLEYRFILKVPPNAEQVESGKGEMRFTMDRDGQIYVTEGRQAVVVCEGDIKQGETVELLFNPDRIRIGNNSLEIKNLSRTALHTFYFWRRPPA